MGLIEFFSIAERLQMLSRKLAILPLRVGELTSTPAPGPPPGLARRDAEV
jgi:hypothetical protein